MGVKGIAALLFLSLLSACSTGNPPAGTSPADPSAAGIPAHETYLRNVTEIRAEGVTVILPAGYEAEVQVSGLTAGWREEPGRRIWEGTGDAQLRVLSLLVVCRELTVTLVEVQEEPEVMITATGGVTMAHSVRGVGSYVEGVDFLHIRNQRRLER